MSIRAQITQKELSNVGLQKNLGILVNHPLNLLFCIWTIFQKKTFDNKHDSAKEQLVQSQFGFEKNCLAVIQLGIYLQILAVIQLGIYLQKK